ncbi:hypothetical protein TSUD_18550 [Trifolium subterraneum]|uniref:DUF7792 domain-containing protein n=1 Tax=Trifolium subterraneum TaxID=3900 RepID=A0A2Z6N384_TRISU|nr:hypothetical protein TSUD_18550 [Trifolium subterraneum]
MKQRFEESIQLADRVTKAAEEVSSFKQQECGDIKSKADKLSNLLKQAAMVSTELYEQPALLILFEIERVLNKALSLLFKKLIFIIIPASTFRKTSSQLENSIGDVSWLLYISSHDNQYVEEYLGFPPISTNDPMIGFIWDQIASLCTGKPEDRSNAALILALLAHQSDRFAKIIMAEGGVVPLLKLMKEGNTQGQENAATAIRLLKLIDSAIILITNSTMRTSELSAHTTRMESKTFDDDVSCSRLDCFLCE